jgi:hypothetical protein
MRRQYWLLPVLTALLAFPAAASTLLFSTGNPDGLMAAATRPEGPGVFEIETGDDFVLTAPTAINSAQFTGLITGGGTIDQVRVEIYRVFPLDSDVGRTSGPPTFSTPQVPTRVNSPSDVALDERDSATSSLSFATSLVLSGFTANNSVQPGGIHPIPGQTTGGDLAVTGDETTINTSFSTPFILAPGHYFFVPQVAVTGGDFLWLSAPRPIVPPGTPFPPGATDLQAWTRDQFLDPDWLRIGTDIVGGSPAPTFNMTFSLTGSPVPEPSSFILLTPALLAVAFLWRKNLRRP